MAESYRRFFDLSLDMMCIANDAGYFIDVNPAWTKVLGYTAAEMTAVPFFDFIHADDRQPTIDQYAAQSQGGSAIAFKNRYRAKDGSYHWFEWMATPLQNGEKYIYAVARDVTERIQLDDELRASQNELRRYKEDLEALVAQRTRELKSTEQQLRHSQKMEAVGRLAGGIAHDFNNHLAVITMTTELILSSGDETATIFKNDIEDIKRAGERAASLTKQLLAFSRQQVLQPTVLNVNTIVMDMDRMMKRLIGDDIELITRLDAKLGHVRADANQIEQVLMNLVVNARDAMPNGGKLTLETANVDLDESYVIRHFVVSPGAYTMFAVSDTGHGMDVATQERIFEPFFTTKEKDKGTGLGLSTIYGIVKQSGGYIWVYSEVGRGSVFKVYLPRVDAPVQANLPKPHPLTTSLQKATVLVAEDEEPVRKLICRILREYGYTVLEADGGTEALKLANSYKDTIHLLVTDVVMPSLSGSEVATQLMASFPDLKVLYLSGYTQHSVGSHGELDPACGFLQKPFAQWALIGKIRELLGHL